MRQIDTTQELRHFSGEALDGLERHLLRRAGQMRCGDDVLALQERVIGRRWFRVEDVEGRSGEMATFERCEQCFSGRPARRVRC